MGKFSFFGKAAKWAGKHADDVADVADVATHSGGMSRMTRQGGRGMPSFGGGQAGGYGRPSMVDRAMNFMDMAGGVGGLVNGATDMVAYGDMSMDAWGAFSDVMDEGFNAHTVGQLGGVVAEGLVYNKLQDFGIPAPVALMVANCAEKFIEDFADKHGMESAKDVAASNHPDTKKSVESQHPAAGNGSGDTALRDGHMAGSAGLAATAIASDPEQSGKSQMSPSQGLAASAIANDPEQSGKSQAADGKTWKSDVADWMDGAGMVIGQFPVIGDAVGAGLGAAGAGMRYADGDTKGAAMSLAGAGANLLPGPSGLLVNGALAVADGSGILDSKPDSAPASEQTKAVAFSSGGSVSSNPSAEVANALKTGGFDLSSLISGGSSVGDESRMNLAGCQVSGMARQQSSRGFSMS